MNFWDTLSICEMLNGATARSELSRYHVNERATLQAREYKKATTVLERLHPVCSSQTLMQRLDLVATYRSHGAKVRYSGLKNYGLPESQG